MRVLRMANLKDVRPVVPRLHNLQQDCTVTHDVLLPLPMGGL